MGITPEAVLIGLVSVAIAAVGYLLKRGQDQSDQRNREATEGQNKKLDAIATDVKGLMSWAGDQRRDIAVLQEQIRSLQLEMKALDERARANHEEVLLCRAKQHELAGKLQAALAELRLLRGARSAPEDSEATG
jgi:uncharacterized protein HemX